jgi:hypothetical protein
MSETIVPASEAQQVEFLKAASDRLAEMGIPPELHNNLITNELAAQAAHLSIPALKEAAMEKEVPSPCDALKDVAESAGDATTDKEPVIGKKKSVKITILKKAMEHAKAKKGKKTPEEKKDEEVMKEIPAKQQGPDMYDGKVPSEKEAAEKVAREALFNSALDHMVTNLSIPEKQAREILISQYGEL